MASGSVGTAALNGALFGFFCYLTYDATNLAVLRGYDVVVAGVDVVWARCSAPPWRPAPSSSCGSSASCPPARAAEARSLPAADRNDRRYQVLSALEARRLTPVISHDPSGWSSSV